MSDKLKAFKIGKDKGLKDDEGGLLGYGESRIQKEHWDKAVAKNGESALLAALGLTDKRKKSAR